MSYPWILNFFFHCLISDCMTIFFHYYPQRLFLSDIKVSFNKIRQIESQWFSKLFHSNIKFCFCIILYSKKNSVLPPPPPLSLFLCLYLSLYLSLFDLSLSCAFDISLALSPSFSLSFVRYFLKIKCPSLTFLPSFYQFHYFI